MKAQILQILTEVQQNTKLPITAQKELLDLSGVIKSFNCSNLLFTSLNLLKI